MKKFGLSLLSVLMFGTAHAELTTTIGVGVKGGGVVWTQRTYTPFEEQADKHCLPKSAQHLIGQITDIDCITGDGTQGGAVIELNDDKEGMMNADGQWVLEPKYNYILGQFVHGFTTVRMDTGHEYFVDIHGKNPFGKTYAQAWNFDAKTGLATVKDTHDAPWYFIDTTGKAITPAKYDFVYSAHTGYGLYTVQTTDGKWGYMDKTGKEVIPTIYEYAMPFDGGVAKVVKDGKHGLIDTKGNVIIPFSYDDLFYFEKSERAIVKKDGNYGLIDKDSNTILAFEYEYMSGISDDQEIYHAKQQNRDVYFDKDGKRLTKFEQYDHVGYLGDTLVPVMKNKKFGYANRFGELVIPLMYDGADTFSEGVAKVTKIKGNQKEIFYINLNNKRVPKPKNEYP